MTDRNPTIQDIDWFIDLKTFRRLDLDPPYQRYSVWAKGYKQYFIDTILNNFPSPAIFLHKESVSTTNHIYHVVDGKQRLTAIFEFLENTFSLPANHDQYPGVYYSDLPADAKISFGNYKITIEVLNIRNTAYLRETFDRLNRNVRKLNSQELRHARHDGPFMKLLETLVEDQFWADLGISTPARMRSMRDIEYVSEIYLLSMHGVLDSSATILDEYFALYDEEEGFTPVEEARSKYDSCLNIMKRFGTDFLRETRYSNLNDFYSLWAALFDILDNQNAVDYDESRRNLISFDQRVTIPENIDVEDQVALRYSDAVRQGANKLNNRQIRAEILRNLIVIR